MQRLISTAMLLALPALLLLSAVSSADPPAKINVLLIAGDVAD